MDISVAFDVYISKGLLFYYFRNKLELYNYVFDYCVEITKSSIQQEEFEQITDFFEILRYGSKVKLEIIKKNPYLTDFILRAYFIENE